MAELKIAVRLDCIGGVRPSTGSLRKALMMVASMGATSVELCGRQLVDVSQLSDTGVRTLRKMLDDLNLRIASIRFPTRHGFDRVDDLDQRVDATKLAMRTAYRLGAPLVVNQIGPVPKPPARPGSGSDASGGTSAGRRIESNLGGMSISGQMPPAGMSVEEAANWAVSGMAASNDSSDEITDPRWDIMRSVLDDLGRYGAKVGAFFAAETGTEPGEYLAELIDTSAESYIAVALNPGQLIVNRYSVPEAVRALGDRIRIVNAVDGVLDLSAGRGVAVPVGQGTADFPSLIGQLEDIPYRGPYVVGRPQMDEDSAMAELAQSVSYLRNL